MKWWWKYFWNVMINRQETSSKRTFFENFSSHLRWMQLEWNIVFYDSEYIECIYSESGRISWGWLNAIDNWIFFRHIIWIVNIVLIVYLQYIPVQLLVYDISKNCIVRKCMKSSSCKIVFTTFHITVQCVWLDLLRLGDSTVHDTSLEYIC